MNKPPVVSGTAKKMPCHPFIFSSEFALMTHWNTFINNMFVILYEYIPHAFSVLPFKF